MSTKRDYYTVLGVERNAGDQELKRAYRRLAMDHHPDRNPGSREAEEKFKEAAEAYQVLSDPERRRQYDQFGHAGANSMGGQDFAGFGGFHDLFSAFTDIFGGQTADSGGDDIQLSLSLSFLEAVKGAKREIEVERHVSCTTCHGSGAKPGTRPISCKTCQGRGQVVHRQGFFTIATECPQCHGHGTLVETPCPTCKGRTFVPESSKVMVTIPAGVDDGTRLRMSGMGHASATPGGAPGDLYIVFQVEPDKRFLRQGDHVRVDVPLTLTQATLGAEVVVPTLEGDQTLTVSPGTQPFEEKVLAGQGIPHIRGRGRGNLIVRFVVKVPTSLSPETQALFEQLAQQLDGAEAIRKKESTFQRLFKRKKDAS